MQILLCWLGVTKPFQSFQWEQRETLLQTNFKAFDDFQSLLVKKDKNYFRIDIKIDENFPVVDEVSCLEDKIWTISSVFCET